MKTRDSEMQQSLRSTWINPICVVSILLGLSLLHILVINTYKIFFIFHGPVSYLNYLSLDAHISVLSTLVLGLVKIAPWFFIILMFIAVSCTIIMLFCVFNVVSAYCSFIIYAAIWLLSFKMQGVWFFQYFIPSVMSLVLVLGYQLYPLSTDKKYLGYAFNIKMPFYKYMCLCLFVLAILFYLGALSVNAVVFDFNVMSAFSVVALILLSASYFIDNKRIGVSYVSAVEQSQKLNVFISYLTYVIGIIMLFQVMNTVVFYGYENSEYSQMIVSYNRAIFNPFYRASFLDAQFIIESIIAIALILRVLVIPVLLLMLGFCSVIAWSGFETLFYWHTGGMAEKNWLWELLLLLCVVLVVLVYKILLWSKEASLKSFLFDFLNNKPTDGVRLRVCISLIAFIAFILSFKMMAEESQFVKILTDTVTSIAVLELIAMLLVPLRYDLTIALD